MTPVEIYNKVIQKGISYSQYNEMTRKMLETTNPDELPSAQKENYGHAKLNTARSSRVEKTYSPSQAIKDAMGTITEPQVWMVITENWCGDSAQNLPAIVKIAELNPLVELKIILRDDNPEIMEEFLTNGTKSIPILAAIKKEGEILFKWGPRPAGAVEVIKQAKAEGLEKEKMYERLHLWYAKDKSKELESEFTRLVK
jgi:hypothetical protein